MDIQAPLLGEIYLTLAQDPGPDGAAPTTSTDGGDGTTPPAGDSSGGGLPPMLMIAIPLLILWFFLLSNGSRKQKKKQAALLASMTKGSKVITVGGIKGSVVEVRDDEVLVKVDESANTRLRFTRDAIRTVVSDKEPDAK